MLVVLTEIYCNKVNSLNPLNAELNTICHLLAILEAHHIFHVGGYWLNWYLHFWVRSQNCEKRLLAT